MARTVASVILQQDRPTIHQWTRKNFVERISRIHKNQLNICVVMIHRQFGRMCVFLGGEKKHISLDYLLSMVTIKPGPPTILFLVLASEDLAPEIGETINLLSGNVLSCWAGADRCKDLVAIACETSLWWNFSSITGEAVTARHVAESVVRLIGEFNALSVVGSRIHYVNHLHTDAVCWCDGEVLFGEEVDHKTLTDNSRNEKVADTLRRIADASFLPRTRHQSPRDNRRCSQALWWLAEMPEDVIDFRWLPCSRLAKELYPNLKQEPIVPAWVKKNANAAAMLEFIDQFICIPAGLYQIGTSEEGAQSEPPAGLAMVRMSEFYMLRRPITCRDWYMFATLLDGESKDSELPAVRRSAFDAMQFASNIDAALHAAGIIKEGEEVALPTEREWEVAARGFNAFVFPWGNLYIAGKCNCDMKIGSPSKPGLYSPMGDSPFQCQDMAGNVREWTSSYAGVREVDESRNTDIEAFRDLYTLSPADRLVVRGGSYSYEPKCVRTWVRNTQLAERADKQTGFRLVIRRRNDERLG